MSIATILVTAMRVAIDATPLLLRSSGVKNYVYYWIRSLQQLAGPGVVSAFPFLDPLGELNHEASPLGYFRTWARLGLVIGSNYLPGSLLNLAAPGADVFHASNILVRKPPARARWTATLHDMTCWLLPEFHTPANVRAAKDFAARVVRRAHGLIAVSEATRADAVRILGLPAEKVQVIYSGVAEAFFAVTPGEVERVRASRGLRRPYALFVGTIEPRKNMDTLLEAWGQLGASVREEFELIVAGPIGWASPGTLEKLRTAAGVRYIGYAAEQDLPGITAGATAFVYPSLYEGFGFPVAQAMAAGVPVITSNVSSLPEVAGGAAVLADPRSPAEIRGALERVLTSPGLREELAGAGRERAKQYRWEECARRSLVFFERIAGLI